MGLDPEVLKRRLKLAREASGLSQAQVGVAIGKSRITIARWEGGHRIPLDKELGPVADLFQVTLDWLLGGPGDPPEATLERKQRAMSRYREMARQTQVASDDWVAEHGEKMLSFRRPISEASAPSQPEDLLRLISSKLSLILQAQRELPKIKGVSEQVMEAIANGQVIPSMAILPDLCDSLNLDLNWVLIGGRNPLMSPNKWPRGQGL